MDHPPSDAIAGTILDDAVELTLEEVSLVCAVREERILALVDEGVLQPRGRERGDWRFPGATVARAARALRLQRELDVDAHAAAVILELLDEIDRLRARLAR
jgi:chaperone modulatory protein CbpM